MRRLASAAAASALHASHALASSTASSAHHNTNSSGGGGNHPDCDGVGQSHQPHHHRSLSSSARGRGSRGRGCGRGGGRGGGRGRGRGAARKETVVLNLGNGIRTEVPSLSHRHTSRRSQPNINAITDVEAAATPTLTTDVSVDAHNNDHGGGGESSPLVAAAAAVRRDLTAHALTTRRGPSLEGREGVATSRGDGSAMSSLAALPPPPPVDALPMLLSADNDATLHELIARAAGIDVPNGLEQHRCDLPTTLGVYAGAQEALAAYLGWLDGPARRTTGRRYVDAFPAELTARLWQSAMPALNQAAVAIAVGQRAAERHRRLQWRRKQKATTTTTDSSSLAVHGRDDGAAVLLLSAAGDEFLAAFRSARRALALRTRELADLLARGSPDGLVLTLARMQHCGALSDDILGPVAACLLETAEVEARTGSGAGLRKVAVNHTLTARMVATPLLPTPPTHPSSTPSLGVEVAAEAMTPAAAITLARLLGRQQAPSHFHLHRLTHTLLMPMIAASLAESAAKLQAVMTEVAAANSDNGNSGGDVHARAPTMAASLVAAAALPPRAALEDLTKCFVHYAVSGSAVAHLTTLWQPYVMGHTRVATGAGQFTIADCTRLLRVVSQPPATAGAAEGGGGTALQTGLGWSGGRRRQRRRESLVAADEYQPLVERLCESAAATCQRLLQSQRPSAAGGEEALALSSSSSLHPAAVTPVELLEWILALLRVDSPRWAEHYALSATAALVAISASGNAAATGAAETNATTMSKRTAMGVDPVTAGARLLPVRLVEQLVYELTHRNTHIPDHPLHRVLLKRLLHSPEVMRGRGRGNNGGAITFANTALLALELMTPPSADGESEATAATASGDALVAATNSSDNTMLMTSALEITAADRAVVFTLLRRHGGSLGATAFVAAMCAAPIGDLPLKAQGRLANHFTSIASAVHPRWLARGIAAAVGKLSPEVVGRDGLSVQRWFSRFTAVDAARRLGLSECAALLSVLAQPGADEDRLANNALACSALVRRVGVLLRSEGEGDNAAALEAAPLLVPALHEANVFFPQLFSRLCRVMLSGVSSAPWAVVLPAFAATADEFVRRPRQEGAATAFRDVWELLRRRVMADAGESIAELEDVLAALNGFAALDGGDRPLFLVLTRRLWVLLAEAMDAEGGNGGEGRDEEEESRRAQLRAALGRHVCAALTPSAIAIITGTLVFKAAGPDVDCMLPWTLMALAGEEGEGAATPAARDLYPIDVVQLMPAIISALTEMEEATTTSSDGTAATTSAGSGVPQWGSLPMHAGLLHRAYDACRSQFLLMYQQLDTTATAVGDKKMGAAAPTAAKPSGDGDGHEGSDTVSDGVEATDTAAIIDSRSQWSAKVTASVDLVPHKYFAEILVQLSAGGLVDPPVATACAARACTPRCCRESLTMGALVDLCMALCMQFPPKAAAATAAVVVATSHSNSSGEDDDADTAAAPPLSENARFMPAVLDALWGRTDELSAGQAAALLRCLRHYYGADGVDADFVGRLTDHVGLLKERQDKAAMMAAAAVAEQQQQPQQQRQEENSRSPAAVADSEALGQRLPAGTALDGEEDGVSLAELMMESLGE